MTHDHHHFTGDFDEMAKTWDDDPTKVERARIAAEQILARTSPTPTTRVLEYGAGTGLVSERLAPHVGALTLADPSAGMRAAIAAKVEAGALPAGSRIWSMDLGTDAVPAEQFDLIVTVQVLHHVEQIDTVLAAFHAMTAPGGHLCIVDLEREDGSFHGDGFGGHHGFDRVELGAQIEAAGFTRVTFEHSYDLEKDGHAYPLFLALAVRPS